MTTVLRDGVLYVTGTGSADHFALVGGADFDAEIVGLGDTTINGKSSDFGLSGNQPVLVDLGGGDDVLEIADGSWWSGQVTVLGGGGNDRVTTAPALYNQLTRLFYAGGPGDDSLSIARRRISGRIDFEGGPGRDRAYLEQVSIGGRLNVVDRAGSTRLTAIEVTLRKPLTFDTGSSVDRIRLESVQARSASIIRTRGGCDTVALLRTPFSDTSVLRLGDDAADVIQIASANPADAARAP